MSLWPMPYWKKDWPRYKQKRFESIKSKVFTAMEMNNFFTESPDNEYSFEKVSKKISQLNTMLLKLLLKLFLKIIIQTITETNY